MNILYFVNTVNLMSVLLNSEKDSWLVPNEEKSNQFNEKSVYVKEDDQDWGSSGMDNIQKDSL